MDASWAKLTPAERMEARFSEWSSAPGVQFASPEAERAYRERAQMFKDVTQLKKPLRVPIAFNLGIFPHGYAGFTPQEIMYDYEKLGIAFKKFNQDFTADALGTCIFGAPGKVFDILDYKAYHWPGHGVDPTSCYQCVEAEYMQADEYDQLIADPSNYFLRTYLPRVFGALEPWAMLPPLTDIVELPFVGASLIPVGLPPVQEAFKKYLEAGQAALEWIQAAGAVDGWNTANLGLPPLWAGTSKAPFDTLGDTLRGTRAIMLDKFRRPKKLLAALDRILPLAIEMGVRWATNQHGVFAFIPLHKGADGFMSNEDFETFYWPTLKGLILGLIEEGVVPWLFVEGGYNQRLDIIVDRDIPDGTTVWIFDRTDMKEVKKRFTGWACFGGNVPASLLQAGTPAEVKDYVKRLIDDVAGDGGYILANGAVLDHAKPENLHAMLEAGREYGVYR
jgi:hypothetical protein